MVGNSVSLHNFHVLKVQARGLSVNIPNNLNKSFSHLFWSYWALSLLKYSPPLFIHPSQCFFQFWKHSWNTSFGTMYSSASKISLISLTDSHHHPFIKDFSLVKRKSLLVQILVSIEYRGWASSHILWENHKSKGENALEHCHDEATIFFPPPKLRPFYPQCLSQPFHQLQITLLVHHLATW